MTAQKIQMDQIRSTSASTTGENIRAGSQNESSLSQAEGLQGASPDATCTCPSGDGSLRHPCPAHPAQVEQAGGNERVIGWRARILAAHPSSDPGFWPDALLVEHMAAEIADLRAALAQPSPAPVCTTPTGENCPGDGVKSCKKCPEQAEAEAERPEVVARVVHSNPVVLGQCGPLNANDELMTVAQHAASVARWAEMFNRVEQERDAALAEVERLTRDRDDCLKARLHYATQHGLSLARVAELTATRNRYGVDAHYFNKNLQRILRDFESFTPDELARSLIILAKVADEKVVAQAQHSVPETINEEANSFLRIADAGQFKDNEVAVQTAAVIIRGLLHRPAIMQSIIRHRIGLTPEYEGQWHADLYGEDGEVQHHAEADTPDEAVRAVVALAAAPGKEGV
ncbi:hypothetical protein ACM9NN_15280 [Pseudomonas paraeruginosa]|uniref:hypothetical protein n=1 Tax=Pseudomonas paraeruginosa TaxID=2994495 RepID=UPI00377345ED|nr:hypothetical protein [Pseudomonas aeruginosa]